MFRSRHFCVLASALAVIASIGTIVCPTCCAEPAVDDSHRQFVLWPQPKQIEMRSGTVSLASLHLIDHAKAPNTEELLQEQLNQQYGFRFAPQETTGSLIIGYLHSPPIVDLLNRWDIKHTLGDQHRDGFLIAVRSQGILLAALNPRGLYYAVRALLRIIDDSTPIEVSPQARCLTVVDYPDQTIRALFWRLDTQTGGRYDLEFVKEYIERIVAGARYNMIVFMMRRGLAYKSHPYLAHPHAFATDEFEDLVAFCRRHYLDVVPATNTPGHADWLLRTRNLHLAELNNATICTRHPEALKLISDVNQEMIDLCGGKERVKFFHVGHDEVRWTRFDKSHPRLRDACPRCKGTPYQELFSEYIRKEHEWFRERGIRMMMWADMFSARHNGSKYGTADLTKTLPMEIVLIPWSAIAYPDIQNWSEEGFEVIKGATGYKQLSIGDSVVSGHMLNLFTPSPWLVFTTTDTSSQNYYNHLSVLLFAENAWNNDPSLQAKDANELENLKTTVQTRGEKKKLDFLLRRGNALNFHFAHRRFPSQTTAFEMIDLTPFANRLSTDCFGVGEANDLSGLHAGTTTVAGIPTTVRDKIIVLDGTTHSRSGIRIGEKAASLVFLQTAFLPKNRVTEYRRRIASNDLKFNMTARNSPVGYYRIHYRDGSQRQVPINFGLNVSHVRPPLHSRYPYDVRFVYRATAAGVEWPEASDCRDLTPGAPALYQYEWVNPGPDRLIESMDFVSLETEVVPALVAITVRRARKAG